MSNAAVELSAPIAADSRRTKQRLSRQIAVAALLVATGLLLLRFVAFDAVLNTIATLFSADGEISGQNRERIAALLVELAVWAGVFSLLAFSLSASLGARIRALLSTDALERVPRTLPDPVRVLLLSAVIGLGIIVLWALHIGTPLSFQWLFVKEGPLELITFLLLLVSAVWLIGAASKLHRNPDVRMGRWSPLIYAVLGAGLFVIGMEEISWGQTYLTWDTPEEWAAINSQQETTLHNLLDQHALHVIAQRLTYLFVGLTLLATYIGIKVNHPLVRALAPHVATVPIVLLVGYAAFRFHLEISEILFAIFISCYSWRIYRAAKIPRRAIPAATS